MSKSIKVSELVFKRIQHYQGPRESYSHVIERMSDAWETLEAIKRGDYPFTESRDKAKQEA